MANYSYILRSKA